MFLGAGLQIIVVFAVKPLIYGFSTVQNAASRVPVPGRVLNCGTLRIDSASEEELVINEVPNVELPLCEANMPLELGDARRRRDRGRLIREP